MSGRVHSLIRKTANQTAAQMAPAVKAALTNEQVTRQRVEKLEEQTMQVQALLTRGLRGRLRWLLTGK